jgi:hypothetical protein
MVKMESVSPAPKTSSQSPVMVTVNITESSNKEQHIWCIQESEGISICKWDHDFDDVFEDSIENGSRRERHEQQHVQLSPASRRRDCRPGMLRLCVPMVGIDDN